SGETPFPLESGVSEESGIFADAGIPEEPGLPAETGGAESNAVAPDVPPEAEMVRRVFGGDIVEIHYSGATGG
ncbi:MAG: hypothetical protein LBH57_04125, partial [Treponema sp.]|nr:hypothetical protein [Treponema sp.]